MINAQFCGYLSNAFQQPIQWFLVLGEGPEFSEESRLMISSPGATDHLSESVAMQELATVLDTCHQNQQVLASGLGSVVRYVVSARYNWIARAVTPRVGGGLQLHGTQHGLYVCHEGGVPIDHICRLTDSGAELDLTTLVPPDVRERKLY